MRLISFSATAIAAAFALASSAFAQTDSESRRAELLRKRAAIDAELAALDPPAEQARATKAPVSPPASTGGDIVVTGRALSLTTRTPGQTATTIDRAAFSATPATTIADIVRLSPGVTVIQGNGPRDIGVSIRGSNARNSFGARNIQVFEDDFPVTQPDGLARFDLTDPHAYGAVDVVRGPSSARYGNYALGGAVNFHTRSGRDIKGIELGLDGGSDAYANLYASVGDAGNDFDYSLFGSFVRADGATGHSHYETGTLNGRATYAFSDRDRITVKAIYNEGEFELATRASYNQYLLNPYQRDCESAATAAPGCGTISVLVNGVNGARIAQTATEGDLARNDRRTIAGVRYEHDVDANLTWRTQGVFDSRVVDQPTSATPFKGTLDSYNLTSDLTHEGQIAGMSLTSFVGAFYNYLDNQSYSFNKTPAGRKGIGAPTQIVLGNIRNMGLRVREELTIAPALQVVAGVGFERSILKGQLTAYAYPLANGPVLTMVPAERHFTNVAPEGAVLWQASDALRLHARIGSGYGIPQASGLFVTPAGVAGNNIALKAQKNIGLDVGAEITLGREFKAEITGYREWFRNEQISQSAGIGLLAYTANAPRSIHQGVEIGLAWKPLSGMSIGASYSYNDHHYTNFAERLSAGSFTALLNRDGKKIPGVIPNFLNGRIGYDQPSGTLAGLGAFAEISWRDRYYIDNSNRLSIAPYTLVNLNLHYDPPSGGGWLSRMRFFASVQNLFDKTYVGSASIIANSLNPATGLENDVTVLRSVTGSIYAGLPRTIYAGVKTKF